MGASSTADQQVLCAFTSLRAARHRLCHRRHLSATRTASGRARHLDPEGVAAEPRAQANRLDQVAQQLADARADWAANAKLTA